MSRNVSLIMPRRLGRCPYRRRSRLPPFHPIVVPPPLPPPLPLPPCCHLPQPVRDQRSRTCPILRTGTSKRPAAMATCLATSPRDGCESIARFGGVRCACAVTTPALCRLSFCYLYPALSWLALLALDLDAKGGRACVCECAVGVRPPPHHPSLPSTLSRISPTSTPSILNPCPPVAVSPAPASRPPRDVAEQVHCTYDAMPPIGASRPTLAVAPTTLHYYPTQAVHGHQRFRDSSRSGVGHAKCRCLLP